MSSRGNHSRSHSGLAALLRRLPPKAALFTAVAILVLAVLVPLAAQQLEGGNASEPVQPAGSGKGAMAVYFLDVGQADSILAELPNGEVMLIDAGNNADGAPLCAYLSRLGVEKIDYLIGTHPHEDHIGGLDQVINTFPIGTVILPRVADSLVPTTKTYLDVLDAIEQKNLRITPARRQTLLEDEGLTVEILSTDETGFPDLNNYSVVVKITYGEISFLFTGDAEEEAEAALLGSGAELSADVLKAGHHGSSTSSSKRFLEAVSPKWAVISCGEGNKYGHPHRETIAALEALSASIYRTDTDQTIVARCDGHQVVFSTGLPSCND